MQDGMRILLQLFAKHPPIARTTEIKFLSLALLWLLLASCGGKEKDQEATTENAQLSAHLLTDTIISSKGYPLILSDSNWTRRYHKDFFKGYKNSKFSRLALIDNYIILDQKDTTEFPNIPVIGRKTTLKANARETTVQLTFVRINYTTINYSLEFTHPRKKTFQSEGTAHLHYDFFLRMDQDRSTASGATYPIAEFEDNKQKKCNVKIRIGYEEMSGSGLQATIVHNCKGTYGNINPENFPTLIEVR